MNRDQLNQQLLESMTRILKGIGPAMQPPEAVGDLSRAQIRVLFALYKHREKLDLKIKDLADRLGVTSAAVTQFTDGLVEKGLLDRQVDPDDRRGIHLALTKKALATFQTLRKYHFNRIRPFFDDFSDEELEQFIHLLAKIKIERK
jgi:DNA-binding MarR family transcriptional regulator